MFAMLIFKDIDAQEFTMPSYIADISACDFDQDGSKDIIVSRPYEDSIVMLYNNGFRGFTINYYNKYCSSFIPIGFIV